MQQMELREQISEIRNADDPLNELGQFMQLIDDHIQAMQDDLTEKFTQDNEQALLQAKDIVLKMQFMHKLKQEAEVLEEDLADLI